MSDFRILALSIKAPWAFATERLYIKAICIDRKFAISIWIKYFRHQPHYTLENQPTSSIGKWTLKYTNPANPVRNFCKQKLRPLPILFWTTEKDPIHFSGVITCGIVYLQLTCVISE